MMNRYTFTRSLLALWFSLLLMSVGHAQGLEERIDSLLQKQFQPNTPGASFLVAKEGEVVYRKSFGLAHLELNIPMEVDHVFEIGSMTKQFTAIAILMLEEQGKLSLTDDITTYLPDYPTHGHHITLHHLLTHTSGIKNYTSIRALNGISKQDKTPMELIDFFKDEPMDFTPGEQFKYSNSGYVILGYVIEKVSGQSYAEFIETQIFQKLGMEHSRYASAREVIPNRAAGYHQREGYINKRQISYTLPYASGSLMSTVSDLFKWQQALTQHTLISEATTRKAFTDYTLNDGTPIHYGYGWHVKDRDGVLSYEHGGSIFGFKSMGVYLPETDTYVIGLSNCDCNSPTQITRDIAQMTLQTDI